MCTTNGFAVSLKDKRLNLGVLTFVHTYFRFNFRPRTLCRVFVTRCYVWGRVFDPNISNICVQNWSERMRDDDCSEYMFMSIELHSNTKYIQTFYFISPETFNRTR